MTLQISRSSAFRSVPPRKALAAREQTLRECDECGQGGATLDNCCERCHYINTAKKRYEESNIPVTYWHLTMGKHYWGDPILLEKFHGITDDLHQTYNNGVCICFAGPHGVGKTLASANILKKAVAKGYQCLYTTLGDIVSMAVSGPFDQKFGAQRELTMVDFLVIDEFDSRHMQSGASADLFGRQMETVFRRRSENGLPTFMCTNSPRVLDSFEGPILQSITSLMNYVTTITVVGKDGRNPKNRGD